MELPTLENVEIDGKRVVIRADLNVPMHDGMVSNDTRIRAVLPTLQSCLAREATIILLSHLGRPKNGFEQRYSLQPVASHLSKILGERVELVRNWREQLLNDRLVQRFRKNRVTLVENLRFEEGEENNDLDLGRELAALGDVYIVEAFGAAHRSHASTASAIECAQEACAGLLFAAEINALSIVMESPRRPLFAVIGGAKIKGKLEVLSRLTEVADTVIVGGGLANTLLSAAGASIGDSLVEPDLLDPAKQVLSSDCLQLPIDVLTCREVKPESTAIVRDIDSIPNDEKIVDIGPRTARFFAEMLKDASTIVWNGPMGIFEYDQFGEGTRIVAEAVAESSAFSVIGGGDTVAALAHHDLESEVDYISTGGGAFLEFIEGTKLPSLAALEKRYQANM